MLDHLRRMARLASPTPLLDLLYPRRCIAPACARSGHWICPSCRSGIARLGATCRRCALPLRHRPPDSTCVHCRTHPPAFDGALAYGPYQGLLKRAILDLKYARRLALAPTLAGLAARAWLPGPSPEPDSLVLALPAHRSRTRERGVDHAARIATAFAEILELEIADGLLVRHRHTRPQVGLSLSERRRNVAGAFRGTRDLGGRPVILVDDVMTTGASASAAAEALRSAGAGRITVCTVARAVQVGVGGLRPPSL